MTTRHRLLLMIALLPCLAWTDIPRSQVVEGNRSFHAGKFTDAIEHYGQALVDYPDSPVLNFNMGAAHYKAGQYTEALSSFSRVQPSNEDSAQDSGRTAKTAYNTGNAQYKMGVNAEEQNPQAALAAYTNALASYRWALGADPTDQDAKFNYEFVTKKIEELQDKLEQQPQQNQQNRQNQQEQRQPQGQQQAEQDRGQNQQNQQDAQQEQQPAREPAEESPQAEQERHASQSPQDQHNEMSADEARSVIDTARNEELSPEEFARQAQRGTVAEALRDW